VSRQGVDAGRGYAAVPMAAAGGPGTPDGPDGAVRAFLDIGTNSVRMVIVQLAPDGTHQVLVQEKETVRLGEGEFVGGDLRPEAMDRAVVVCRNFADMARANGAHELIAVATAATREARNRLAFTARLRAEAGLEVRTISGREEARLIHLGVASGLHLGDRRAVFVDVGGGSTEVIIGGQHAYEALDSLKVGAIRLANLFLAPGDPGPVSKGCYRRMMDYVRNAALRSAQRLRELPTDLAVAGSGTAETLADISARRALGRPRQRDDVLSLKELAAVARWLRKMPLAERRRVPGMNAGRADIIVPGAAILESLFVEFGLTEARITDRGLREGLIVDFLAGRDPQHLRRMTVRERSVLNLGRACHFDEAHARSVAHLAAQLFDSAARLALHEYGPAERELLVHAAMLHDIGTFLSPTRHDRHASYLVRNADLLGFDGTEIALIAAVARFHRRGFPHAGRAELADLDERARRAVALLSVLLRLAESLDRSHAGLVESAAFRRRGRRSVTLSVRSAAEPTLELWGARQHLPAFQRAFGCRLKLRCGPAERPAVAAP